MLALSSFSSLSSSSSSSSSKPPSSMRGRLRSGVALGEGTGDGSTEDSINPRASHNGETAMLPSFKLKLRKHIAHHSACAKYRDLIKLRCVFLSNGKCAIPALSIIPYVEGTAEMAMAPNIFSPAEPFYPEVQDGDRIPAELRDTYVLHPGLIKQIDAE